MRMWALQAADIGRLTNAVQFGFILGTLGFSLSGLADRFPASRIFACCAVLGALANAGFALLAQGLGEGLAWRFVVGLALAAFGLFAGIGAAIDRGWIPVDGYAREQLIWPALPFNAFILWLSARITLPAFWSTAQHEQFHRHADQGRRREAGDDGDDDRAGLRGSEGGGIGADHVERAMGEVDHAHDAEDQRQPGREQEQHHAELQAVEQLFENERH